MYIVSYSLWTLINHVIPSEVVLWIIAFRRCCMSVAVEISGSQDGTEFNLKRTFAKIKEDKRI